MALRKFVSREIGNNIKRIRRDLDMSQEQFGKAAGNYSQDSVVKWESGQVPHALVLLQIARMGNCSVDSILEREPKQETVNSLVMEIKRNVNRLTEIGTEKKPKRRNAKKS